jgi:hypothetical protein
MPTILDLFNDATKISGNKFSIPENDIYGKNAVYIESKGLVNIPRQVALLASSPNSVADLIGGQLSGYFGASANRPSDTIFPNDKPFSKPITVLGGTAISELRIKNAVEAGKNYFVKQNPSPASIYQTSQQGAGDIVQTSTNIAADLLLNPLATANSIKAYASTLKKKTGEPTTYGATYTTDPYNGKSKKETAKFSTHSPIYIKTSNGYKRAGLEKRENIITDESNNTWEYVNNNIINGLVIDEEVANEGFDQNNITRVVFTNYRTKETIILPGTISGLSEDHTPEWTTFRYVGSPFNVYRYKGLERAIKFNLKLYYTDAISKKAMQKKIEFLRNCIHPNKDLSIVTYGSGDLIETSALTFSPNLVYFSITGLYNKLLAVMDDMDITIDDNTTWATVPSAKSAKEKPFSKDNTNPKFRQLVETAAINNQINIQNPEYLKSAPYPTVVDISIGLKIIPEHNISSKSTYIFKHTGYENRERNASVTTEDVAKANPTGAPATFDFEGRSSTPGNLYPADNSP